MNFVSGAAGLVADAPLRRAIAKARDYFHLRPQRGFRPRTVVDRSVSSVDVAAALAAQGVCVVPGLVEPELLSTLKTAFDGRFVDAVGRARGATDVPGTFSQLITPFELSGAIELILHEVVLAAVEMYYRRPVFLAATQMNRLDPVEPFEGDSYQWHHDDKGKYVKAMWLLTDVEADGQRMSYQAASHGRRRIARSYQESRFSDDEARAAGTQVVECVGPAGTLVLFDTNGIHRGNRNWGPRRDVLIGMYSVGRHLQGCPVDASQLAHLSESTQAIVRRSQMPSRGYESKESA